MHKKNTLAEANVFLRFECAGGGTRTPKPRSTRS